MLKVSNLARLGTFKDVSFTVEKGEIICFSGLVGAGRTDVALALFGIAPADSGVIELDGETVVIDGPRTAQKLGIAYVSEDRRKLGIAMAESITTNITLPVLARYCNALGLIDKQREALDADRFRQQLNIKTANLDVEVGTLSGGNQQKVMLAKWLNTNPGLLIVDEPTRGIDIGAKAEVHHIIRDLATQGVAVIIISSDLPEVLSLADRVLVMREGHLVGEFSGKLATQESIIQMAVGADRQDEVA